VPDGIRELHTTLIANDRQMTHEIFSKRTMVQYVKLLDSIFIDGYEHATGTLLTPSSGTKFFVSNQMDVCSKTAWFAK